MTPPPLDRLSPSRQSDQQLVVITQVRQLQPVSDLGWEACQINLMCVFSLCCLAILSYPLYNLTQIPNKGGLWRFGGRALGRG